MCRHSTLDGSRFRIARISFSLLLLKTAIPRQHKNRTMTPSVEQFPRIERRASFRRISHDQSYVNYNAFTGEVIPSPVKKYPVVELPEELVPTVEDMHCPKLQRRGEVVEELFFETRNRYVYGDLYEKEPEIWTVLWEPSRLKELTTLTVQSTICAALNSRKRLAFIIGVTLDKKIIGCQLSTEQINKMKELFELCITSEFVPALDEGLAHFYFYPVYDQSGHEIPSRFVVEIAVRDAVTTLYQLSSGRVYYVSGDAVACTKSFDEAIRMLFRRRQAEFKPALEDPEQKQK
ncbi:hypothetical protein OESDEN_13065 [Oesophagostomum dentatum]|uniref:Schlafen AlbA-2 domain-containing protein n=1 Tax=Oesophagostomum dentatum TaxID=61180 RepID=A0A0B1SVI1_OESDE|nr:hypothetical protein OESDEN_13065 [Oesophagostomum dentatum]